MRSHFKILTPLYIFIFKSKLMIKKCEKCGEEKEHEAKGLCFNCYRKYAWKPKKIICKRCKRELPMHAKGVCSGCYNFIFHSDKNKAYNYKKYHNIEPALYKKITKSCVICGFDKTVDLHHLDNNKKNNSESNLIGICPNHHKMLHTFEFKKEIRELLKEKGYSLQEDERLDFKHKEPV